MIIATAGHVDHGKTALLRALTGVEGDRLPEEKKRGMTIDLGYVYLPLAEGQSIGFIDVPGHERFLSNMLSGVGCAEHALLVVAADDGIMPQTREHLSILQLLGMKSLTIAINKIDLVDSTQVQQLSQQLHAELSRYGQPLPYTLFAVSAHTEAGITDLRQHLSQLAHSSANTQQRFRLAIDRAFSLSGAGLVVTGTAFSGQVQPGDTLWLSGVNCPVRVRSLHAQNQASQQGYAGQRLALNLVGDVHKQDISRGLWLLQQAPPTPSSRVTVQLQVNPALSQPLKHWQAIQIHHAASHSHGHLALLDHTDTAAGALLLAEVSLAQALHLVEGDKLLLRDASAQRHLGCAKVLELHPPQRAKRHAPRLTYLQQLAQQGNDASQALIYQAQWQAVHLPSFAWARQLHDAQLAQLVAASALIIVDEHAYHPQHWQRQQQQLLDCLAQFHQKQAEQMGISRGNLKRLALPQTQDAAVQQMLEQLIAQGRLQHSRGWLHLPEHVISFQEQEAQRWQQVQAQLASAPFAAHWVRELSTALNQPEEELRLLMRKAARLGHIHAVVPDRYLSHTAVQAMAQLIQQHCQSQGYIEAAQFRDELDCGRKLAIQILEYFDQSGFTRRLNNRHFLSSQAPLHPFYPVDERS